MRMIYLMFSLFFVGCSAPAPQPLPPQLGWEKLNLSTGEFHLSALLKTSDTQTKLLTIYIEGDGHAWVSRSTPAADPTPQNPVAKHLAFADTAPAVAYLARPCQYEPRWQDGTCARPYWTHKRFAPEVVASLNHAMSQLKAKVGAKSIHLVGYSGGGGLAALVAAERADVASLRTVAGNLDTEAFTRHHKVSPMTGSLNPVQVAAQVAHIPQMHYVGAADTTVPPFIAENFIRAQQQGNQKKKCAQQQTIGGATHSTGWVQGWPQLATKMPQCQ